MRSHQQTSGKPSSGNRVCREIQCRKIILINALMNRKSYARISAQAGQDVRRSITITLTMNFIMLIFPDMDMPK